MNKKPLSAVLANNNFIRLWITQIISQTSAYLLNFVLLVKIYALTHSTRALSVFLMFYMAPSLLLGLFSGVLIDYWDKRRVLMLTNFIQGLVCLLYIPVGNTITLLYLVVFLYSLCDEFFTPAQQSILPSIIRKEQLTIANALLMFTNQAAIVFGALVGSVMVKWLPAHVPFLIVGAGLFFAAKYVSPIPNDNQFKGIDQRPKKKITLARFAADFKEGYAFIVAKPRIFYPFVFYVFAQVLTGLSVVLFPALAEDIFQVSVYDSGLAIFFPIGIGALVGTMYLNAKIHKLGRKVLISFGWLIAGSAFLALGLLVPKFPFPYVFAAGCMVLLGFGAVLVIVTSLLMIQENTPLRVRGRIFATLSAFLVISTYLPLYFLASITDRFGILTTVMGMGGAVFAIGLISFTIDRRYVISNGYRA